MTQPTTSTATGPSTDVCLLPILLLLLSAHRPAFRQERPYQRCVALTLGHLTAFSRHTITQLLISLGLGGVDWSGFYRLFSVPRLNDDQLTTCFLAQTLEDVPATTPYQVGLDGVQIPRSSQRMPGSSWLKAPRTPPWRVGIHRAQRFVHLAWLVPSAIHGYSRAIPLRVEPAFPAKAATARHAPITAPRREWEAGRDAVIWLRTALDAAGRMTQRILAVADSAYGPAALWTQLPHDTTLLTRCAKNRALFRLPAPHTGRGRPRRYGQRAPTPQAWLHRPGHWQQVRLTVRGHERDLTYRVCGPYLLRGAATQPVFLLVVRGVARRRSVRRDPTFWLVSAVPTPTGRWRLPDAPITLLALAWQRWELEVTHRDAKTGFGVGEVQCWSPSAAILAVQWQWWVLGLVLLTGYRRWGLGPAPTAARGGWWRGSRRWSLGSLWQVLRAELWDLADFQPAWTRFTPNWWEMADWIDLHLAAVLGARRG
ncbi:MAG: transposase [Thermomicrobiales bacterium]|nr:transposase [Thermomicrobiales bacterium]